MNTKKFRNFFSYGFFKAHVDWLLMILALLVLAAGLIRALWGKPVIIAPSVIELRFTHYWQSDLGEGVLEELAREFEESRENVKIILDPRSRGEVRKLIFNYNPGDEGSGEIPQAEIPGDVLAIDPLWARELFAKGTIDPSSGLAEPLVSFFYPLFYNIELLKAAGFSRPPKTRSELSSFAGAVTDPVSGRYGIAFALGENNSHGVYRDIYPWFWAAGLSLLESVNAGEKAVEETLAFFSGLREKEAIHPEIFSMDEDEKREAFIKNKIAFMTAPVQDIAILRREMGENAFGIGVVPVPDSYSGKPVFGASGWSLGVLDNGKYREEAEDFVSFLEGKSSFLAEKAGAVPGGGNSLAPDLMRDPFYSKAWELYISGELVREFTEIPGETERETVFRNELAGLFEKNKTPSSAAEAIRKSWGK